MLNEEEKTHFRQHTPVDLFDARVELVQLTCAAINGLFQTATAATPEGFGNQAVRIAIAAQQSINQHFKPKE